MPYVYPNGLTSAPIVTTPWMGYPNHFGCDSINHPGGGNYALADGEVVYAGYNPSGAGNEVRIQGDDGNIYRELHFARVDVNVGARVSRGDWLGLQGATGDATGIHCHTEIWVGGTTAGRLDPWPYIAARLSSPSGGGGTPIPGGLDLTKLGDIMLCQNRTSDNVLALYDEFHWQEFHYGPGASQWMKDLCSAWARTVPNVPVEYTVGGGWDYRSNKAIAIKNPIYLVDEKSQKLTLISYLPSSGEGGGGSAPTAEQNATAVAAKLAPSFDAIPTAAENGTAARAAIVK